MRLCSHGLILLLSLGASPSSTGQEATPPSPQEGAPSVDPQGVAQRDQLWAEAWQLATDGKYELAIAKGEATLALERELFGDDAADVADSLRWLAGQYLLAQQLDKAVERARQYQQLCPAVYGEDAWQTVAAKFYEDYLDRLSKIEPQRLTAMQAIEAAYGELSGRGRHVESAEKLKELLVHEREVLGPDHPYYANSHSNIASAYELAVKYADADRHYAIVWAIRYKRLHSHDPSVLDVASRLGRVRVLSKQYAAAIEPLREARKLHLDANRNVDAALLASWLGDAFAGLGKAEDAASVYRQSLAEFRQLGHPKGQAVLLNRLAGLYETMADYARAEPLYQQALEIRKDVLGEQHPSYTTSLNNLAYLYDSMGDYARAEPLYQQALKIRKEVLGEQHPDYATSLNNLAGLYETMADYARAEPLYKQAMEIRKEVLGEQHPDYATSLNNLAYLYDSMADYARAEPLYREAMEIIKEVLGKKHPDYATSLNNLGYMYKSMGDYARAEPLYRQALEIRKEVLGEQHTGYAGSLNNLATLYHNIGDYARAEPLLREASEIWKELLGEKHPTYATNLNNLATLYHNIGDHARAEPLYRETLEIRKGALGEQHPDYAASLNGVAGLYYSMADYARAEPLYRQSLEIIKEVLGKKHPDYATSLNNLGYMYKSMGDYARAAPFLREALEIRKEVLGEEHRDYATSLSNLAALYDDMADYARAEPLHLQALEITKEALGERHPNYALILNNLAFLCQNMGDNARAEPLYREASEITREHLDVSALVLSERQQLAMGQMLRSQLDNYIYLAVSANDYARSLFEEVLAWKGATLVRQRGMRLAAGDPAVAEQFTKLQQVARQLAALARAVPDQPGQQERMGELTKEKERLEAELNQQSAAFRAAQQEITFAELINAIPKDAVLVDYVEYGKGGRELIAFVVRHEEEESKQVTLRDLGPVAPISEAIDTWRQTFGMSPEGKRAGRTLREKIWEPLLLAIGDAKTVLVSTDGILGRLPLGGLPGRERGTYLLEDHRLATIPVPQLLPALVNDLGRKRLRKAMLLMGNVDYDDQSDTASEAEEDADQWNGLLRGLAVRSGDERFRHLPETEGEIATIERLLRRTSPRIRDEHFVTLSEATATEVRFREFAPQCYFLHLATHGFFADPKYQSAESSTAAAQAATNAERLQSAQEINVVGYHPGLLSGLAFSGANGTPEPDQDDGILTSQEIAFLPLEGVQLVTLSACETGLGESAGGEGLLGIQRAFQVSGAQTTVASFWQVNDLATRVIMERFYRNLWVNKMGKLDALRDAQLYILNNPDVVRGANPTTDDNPRTSPEFWGAFSLSGDWR